MKDYQLENIRSRYWSFHFIPLDFMGIGEKKQFDTWSQLHRKN